MTAADGSIHWIAPVECAESLKASALLQSFPVSKIHVVDLKQSMRNGGGPACLRLRVPLTQAELAQVPLVDSARLDALETLANTHYRDRLTFADLRDPKFMAECVHVTRMVYDALN